MDITERDFGHGIVLKRLAYTAYTGKGSPAILAVCALHHHLSRKHASRSILVGPVAQRQEVSHEQVSRSRISRVSHSFRKLGHCGLGSVPSRGNPEGGDGTPECDDQNAKEWRKALQAKQAPPSKIGFIYMLAGDMGTSNHDSSQRHTRAPDDSGTWYGRGYSLGATLSPCLGPAARRLRILCQTAPQREP